MTSPTMIHMEPHDNVVWGRFPPRRAKKFRPDGDLLVGFRSVPGALSSIAAAIVQVGPDLEGCRVLEDPAVQEKGLAWLSLDGKERMAIFQMQLRDRRQMADVLRGLRHRPEIYGVGWL